MTGNTLKTMRYVRQHGIVRPRDVEAVGIPREYLLRLYRQGKLDRSGRGMYTLPNAPVTEHHSYAEVAKRVPEAVLCLLSALAFHELRRKIQQLSGSPLAKEPGHRRSRRLHSEWFVCRAFAIRRNRISR